MIIRYKRNITPCVLFLFFSNTYNSVQANANQIWKFQRYYLVMEYAQRPVLVPPFIILNHVIHLIKGIYRRLRKSCRQKTVDREDSTRSYGLSMCIALGRPSAVSLSFLNKLFGSFYVSVKLPTYPSPKPTLTLSSYLGQNVG